MQTELEKRYDAALAAIMELFSYTRVTQEETLEQLEALNEQLEMLIETLRDEIR
jgi:hypothetical protein